MVNIRSITVGDGIPKICVPVTAAEYGSIIKDMKNIYDNFRETVDIIEFRADFFEEVSDIDRVKKILGDIRIAIGDIPLIFTFRTKDEGGERSISLNDYENLLNQVTDTGMADAVDVEIMRGGSVFQSVLKKAHGKGIKVIASNHDFNKTPDKNNIVAVLKKMEDAGADIAKIAVMPENERDVLTLLSASLEAKESLNVPIITISMGKLGAVSRLAGETFGSSVTFGVATESSAPGQMAAKELRGILELLH